MIKYVTVTLFWISLWCFVTLTFDALSVLSFQYMAGRIACCGLSVCLSVRPSVRPFACSLCMPWRKGNISALCSMSHNNSASEPSKSNNNIKLRCHLASQCKGVKCAMTKVAWWFSHLAETLTLLFLLSDTYQGLARWKDQGHVRHLYMPVSEDRKNSSVLWAGFSSRKLKIINIAWLFMTFKTHLAFRRLKRQGLARWKDQGNRKRKVHNRLCMTFMKHSVFTAGAYARTVLGVVILSVRPSVCHTRGLWQN